MLAEYNKSKGMSDIISSKMSNLSKVNKMAEGGEVKEPDEMETVAAEIILSIDKKDPQMLVKSLCAFFSMCDSMPHEGETEGPGALLISGEI
jgi:hypothetical protein